MTKKLTNEEYIKQLKELGIWEKYQPVEEYINNSTKINHKCLTCEHIWSITPANLKKGRRCPKCSNNYIPTNEEYREEAISLGYEPLEVYVNNQTNITHKCLKCGYVWSVRPGNLKSGKGCPKCSGKYVPTNEEYREEAISLGYEPLEVYVNNQTNITHKCLKCGYVWKIAPATIKAGHGCPKCYLESKTMTNDEYIQQLKNKGIWNIIRPIEEYKGNRTKIRHRCLECSNIWSVTPANLKQGKICPRCANTNRMEVLFQEKMNELGIPCTPQKSYDTLVSPYGGTLRFDFLIEVYGEEVLIEIDGIQHFKPVEYWGGWSGFVKQRRKDDAKFKWCLKNGIQLIRVPNLVSDKESLLEQYIKTIKDICV